MSFINELLHRALYVNVIWRVA